MPFSPFAVIYLVTFCCSNTGYGERNYYNGYKMYSVIPKGDEMTKLADLYHDQPDVRLLENWSNASAVMLVAPAKISEFERYLNRLVFNYSIIEDDIGKALEEEQEAQKAFSRIVNNEAISFNRYYRYDEIQSYLKKLSKRYPETVKIFSAGESFEGRNLLMIKISSCLEEPRPAIFINAGIHGREWISPAVALYIIKELVENPKNQGMIEKVDWYINTLSNPDGYEYSHTTDRFWRKTRSGGPICYGVDPNRNFDHHWRESGSSRWPCSEVYAGRYPFSERETAAIRNVILKNADHIKLFLDLHSYAQVLIYPWGYTSKKHPRHKEFKLLGDVVARAIGQVRGTKFQVGSCTELLPLGAGGSDDWALGEAKIPYVYTVELPPRSFGYRGFILPPSNIRVVGEETFEGIKVFHKFVEEAYA